MYYPDFKQGIFPAIIFLQLGSLIFDQDLSAQIIEVRVKDAEIQEAIPPAQVFFDGTFLGTSSD